MGFLVRNPLFTNPGRNSLSVGGTWKSYHWRCRPSLPPRQAASKNSIEPHLSQKSYPWAHRHHYSLNISKDSHSVSQSWFRRLHYCQNSSPMNCGIAHHRRDAKGESRDISNFVVNRWRLSCQHQQVNSFCQQGEQGPIRDQAPWRVLFFGTDSFSLPHLEVLHKAGKSGHIDRLEVVVPETKFVKRRGRTRRVSPVWEYCEDHELCYRHWPLTDDLSGFDLGIIVSFGHLLPEWLIKSFPLGILNVHPSLLPRWRGGAPIQHTILNGDTTTGVSIMRILPDRFDVGPILLQRECEVPEGSTSESLTDTLSKMGSEMLLEVMSDVRGFIANERRQNDDGVTFGRKIPSSLAWVNWDSSVVDIGRLYRAIGGQMPLRTMLGEEDLRLEQMVPPQHCSDVAVSDGDIPGSVTYHKQKNIICVRCRDGFVGFRTVAPIGRKRMQAQDFYNGYLSGVKGTQTPVFTNCSIPESSSSEDSTAKPSRFSALSKVRAMTAERTFIMVKPDGVARGLIGDIVKRFERRGYKMVAGKFMKASDELLTLHYKDLKDQPFFPRLLRNIGSGPVFAMVWEGKDVVKQGRSMLGETDPLKSKPGSIRGDFSIDLGRNVIHGSDSVETANKEIALWFEPDELVDWALPTFNAIYDC